MTPDERRARRRELYKANRTKILARQKALRDQNREKVREQARARYQVNRDRILARGRVRRAEDRGRRSVREVISGSNSPRTKATVYPRSNN
jgi:hypothetical protein